MGFKISAKPSLHELSLTKSPFNVKTGSDKSDYTA